MPVGAKQTLRFGPFELDPQCGQLRKNGAGLKLQGQPIQILEILLEKPGELVTREELRQRLWASDTFVDFDHSLNTAIKKLRQALGDEADTPRYIETLPKRGYRFIGEVEHEEPKKIGIADPTETEGSTVVKTRPILAAVAIGASTEKRKRRRRIALLVTAIALLIVTLGTAAYLVTRPPRPPRIVASHVLTNSGYRKASLNTDGRSLYFQELRPSGRVTLRIPVSGGEPSEVPAVQGGYLRDISRDGSRLLFFVPESGGGKPGVWVQPLPSGEPRMITRDVTNWAIFTADGRGLFVSRNNDTELHRVDIDGTGSLKVATLPDITLPHLSPDASRIRFAVAPSFLISMWEVGADGSDPHPIHLGPNTSGRGTWSPDGRFYFFDAWDGERKNLRSVSEERHWWKKSEPIPQALTVGPTDMFLPTMSADGKQLFAIGIQHQGELSVYDRNSGKFVPYLSGISVCYVDFSRDGQWIAYVTYPEGTLWRSRIDGSERMQLTSPPLAVMLPRWSPDGRLIAFTDLSNGDRQQMTNDSPHRIYVVSADGGSPLLLLAGYFGDPTWSPDGTSIAYAYHRPSPTSAESEVRILNFQTQKSTTVPGSRDMWSPRWSPDGKFLVALSAYPPKKLMLFDFATKTWEELASGTAFGWPSWSRDSKFVHAQDGASLVRIAVSERNKQQITSLLGFRVTAYYMDRWNGGWFGLTPDGRPITTRDASIEQIYAFDLEYK